MKITLLVFLASALAFGVEFPLTFDSSKPSGLVAVPEWAPDYGAKSYTQGVFGKRAFFAVGDVEREMKWYAPVNPPKRNPKELIVRYAVNGIGPNANINDTYFLWVYDSAGQAEHLLVDQSDLIADGKWHTLKLNVMPMALREVSQMALHLTASKEGPATLWLDYIDLTD